jgi:Co/Zn/Cd efflux system component
MIHAGNDLRRAISLVAVLNLAYFAVEFSAALAIGSVSLFADSIDFVEDASLNLLILIALAWSAKRRAQLGMVLAGILLIPSIATLYTAWHKFMLPVAPEPLPLTVTGAGAPIINIACAYVLARHRQGADSLMRAAFLSARNDALANVAIIIAGLLTALAFRSAWPDLIVGICIFIVNADAAREVFTSARDESRSAAAS